MAVGIEVLGNQFQKVSFNEEMKRVSFYMVPSIIQFILTVHFYFSPAFRSTDNYNDFNQKIVSANPAMIILGGIVLVLGTADCITFFMNNQRRALHDLYAGTYVVEKYRR
jgi:Na+/H+ antiporter NhaD/arsenite permease-like protein